MPIYGLLKAPLSPGQPPAALAVNTEAGVSARGCQHVGQPLHCNSLWTLLAGCHTVRVCGTQLEEKKNSLKLKMYTHVRVTLNFPSYAEFELIHMRHIAKLTQCLLFN